MKGTLKVRILENSKPTSARVHLLDSQGEWRYAPGCLAYERDWHFTVDGGFSVNLPQGGTGIMIEKGKEYGRISDQFHILPGKTESRVYELQRWVDMNGLGWYSGDTHVHRDPRDILHLMDAEDLNLAPILSYWNQRETFEGAVDEKVVRKKNRAYGLVNQEDERAGGAIMGLNLKRPVKTKTSRWHPSQAFFAQEWRKQGGIVEQEKPFWREAPINVALGFVDSMGIINNHLQRMEVMSNEAWGRPRDIDKYPGIEGFVQNVLDLYYRYLNLGIKVPITAGSASGVLRNPLGYNRLYVRLEKGFGYEEWFKGMKAGRAFATNGPMLFLNVDGDVPSLTLSRPSPTNFKIDIEALSCGELDRIELIRNGRVVRKFPGDSKSQIRREIIFDPEQSCWVAVRVFEKSEKTVVLAHSNPVFLEIPDPMLPSPEDAIFYRSWCEELLECSRKDPMRYASDRNRKEVEGTYECAISFYEKIAYGGG